MAERWIFEELIDICVAIESFGLRFTHCPAPRSCLCLRSYNASRQLCLGRSCHKTVASGRKTQKCDDEEEAKRRLASMSEPNLAMMNQALLRLVGMLFIEAAKIMTDVADTRRRDREEVVEVEVEEDEESYYMRQSTKANAARMGTLQAELGRNAAKACSPGRCRTSR